MARRFFRPATALAVLLVMPLLRPVSGPSSGRVPLRGVRPDLNRDPPARIRLVPGIGPARARAIVEERRRGGPYSDHADVGRRVPGIGPALVRRLARFSETGR
jgi:hypothetical protein